MAEFKRIDSGRSESALPDAIDRAKELEAEAHQLKEKGDPQSDELMDEARRIVFKELNELDGFDR